MPEAPDLPVKEDLKDTSIRQLNTYIEKERYLELQKLADDNNITLSGLILACYAEVLAYERKCGCSLRCDKINCSKWRRKHNSAFIT